MINTTLLRPYNLALIVGVAIVGRILFNKAIKALDGGAAAPTS